MSMVVERMDDQEETIEAKRWDECEDNGSEYRVTESEASSRLISVAESASKGVTSHMISANGGFSS
jgi:hypothetical protein